MESWEDVNYCAFSPQKWVEFMNLSTAEWGIGPFPPGVVALPGELNDTSAKEIPEGTAFVIPNAGRGEIGAHRDIEKVVFGLCSSIAFLFGVGCLYMNWKTLLSPPNHHFGTNPWERTLRGERNLPADFMTEGDFERELGKYYDPAVGTGDVSHEIREEPVVTDGRLAGTEIEKVTDLLRQMYKLDMKIWSLGDSDAAGGGERNELRRKSDAVLREIRRVVREWENPTDPALRGIIWEAEERREIEAILNKLDSRNPDGLPEERYAAFYRR
ncbi:hypothetical protein MKZ38_001343 [Zalerion maritima]|uniref:Uncharacterized protein n=1 Tax=Zalerion maritima TaxID=339359 RepID=A0AAD5RRB1_9PEZI|nr:hypothetical protein MKZ38_001343 [Zalerion maritima]